ncbi:universal stress protein [Neolewinella litorea]|uniref:Universal stress protein n=1 Tax=Neolewinella litorea TaxID=2562452 RepID=A0A4S4NVL6_9BACT|nr:universal stress protein [Neolewinella litorea]THH40300.1 universal stress protein [Neolewinella litorea]
MEKISSILVPTDFSPLAYGAYHYALHLAEKLDASIDLLYVIPPTPSNPNYGTFVDNLTASLQKEARTELVEFSQRGISGAAGSVARMPGVRTFVRVGELRFCLRQHVEREGNQLIIMGTAGRQWAVDDWWGTNASAVASRPPCPVLVIPDKVKFKPFDSICFATDLHSAGIFQARTVLKALGVSRSNVHFLHVRTREGEVTDFDLRVLQEVFDRPEDDFRARFSERIAGDTIGAIFAYAFEQRCGLVVMHRPDRPWFQRLLHKSATREAVLRARLPLLILTAGVGKSSAPNIESSARTGHQFSRG